jgi:H+/Cl- antiporter ClcA
MRSKRYVVFLVIVAIVGVIVSLAAWCFLELVHQIQQELYTHLPHALGYPNGPPLWWSLPVLAIGALITALAITRLPGNGGHLPALGLQSGPPVKPVDLPGILLAAFATIGSGLVLGPEAPLIALGTGTALITIRAARRQMAPPILLLIGAAGAFAAVSFLFESPVIAAILMIEVTGLGGPRLRLLLIPGLLAAGIGSLVSIGMGKFTGLSTSAYAISALQLPHFTRPDIAEFGWTIALGAVVAVIARFVMLGGLGTSRVVVRAMLLLLPIVGLIIAGLAIAFHGATDKSVNEVLFSGQNQLPGLVEQAGTWSLGALALLIVFKGLAWLLSLGSFRGGPTFPALFLGAAGGLMASHLPGFPLEPAVAVGMGAAVASVLQLPLTAIVLATFLTVNSGTGDEPLIIVGVVVAYIVTLAVSAAISKRLPGEQGQAESARAPTAATPAGATAGGHAG